MATATIGVYVEAKEVAYDVPDAVISVSFTGTPGESTEIPGKSGHYYRCRIVSDANCKFSVGAAPDTAVDGQLMGAYATEYMGIRQGHKVEFVTV
jgi:hypothetical protein